jgi:hypothetical protein
MKIRPLRSALALGVLGAATLVLTATPAHAVLGTGLYRVSATSVSDATSPKSITASCNPGDDAVGLGGHINDDDGAVLMTRMTVNNGLDTVTVQGAEAIATADPWSVTGYVMCAPAGAAAGLQLVTTVSVSDPNDKVNIAATCPANRFTFGGGYQISNPGVGNVAVDELTFNATLTTVNSTAYVYNAGVGNFTLTTQAICGTRPPIMSFLSWTSASNTISTKIETSPTCPTGGEPSATGAVLTGATGGASVAGLEPHVSGLATESTAREIGTFTGSWTLQNQAICVG